jgi:uncharacterized repeat protein (TIGR03943 family)
MAHDHDHSQGSAYYLDQLCTIAACGALGGVCLMMFLDGRLRYILTPFFFIPVLAGGIALIVMVAIRALTLWREAGANADHDHAHEHHHHDHDHEHPHDHAHGHEHHHHDHDHDHGHDHAHDHAHDHGHDHGWTPARYAVLMLPIVLYFLNMPNSTFSAEGYGHMMSKDELDQTATQVASKEGAVLDLGFKELSNAALDPTTRKAIEGRTGRLKGMYSPRRSDKEFTLFRVKMSCCAADAIPVGVIIISEENITRIQPKEWVEVTGQIQFHKLQGQEKWMPVLYLKSADQLQPTAALSDYLDQ